MRGLPPFEAPGGARSPAAENPFALIEFALQPGRGIQVIRFDATVQEVRLGMAPPAFTCTSASKLHTPPECGPLYAEPPLEAPAQRCATCGALVPYHDFPARGLRRALVVVNAPAATGDNLQGPAEERDGYLLIHIPRATLGAFDEEADRRIILPGGNGAGPRIS